MVTAAGVVELAWIGAGVRLGDAQQTDAAGLIRVFGRLRQETFGQLRSRRSRQLNNDSHDYHDIWGFK